MCVLIQHIETIIILTHGVLIWAHATYYGVIQAEYVRKLTYRVNTILANMLRATFLELHL